MSGGTGESPSFLNAFRDGFCVHEDEERGSIRRRAPFLLQLARSGPALILDRRSHVIYSHMIIYGHVPIAEAPDWLVPGANDEGNHGDGDDDMTYTRPLS